MKDRKCITFAGAVGSSKTPIANYLSTELNLPILNNDAIRTQVTEDFLTFDKNIYDQRQEDRCKAMLATGNSFIHDASVDRKWSTLHDWLTEQDYEWFIISLDLSYDLLIKLYEAKKYTDTDQLTNYFEQHEEFLSKYNNAVGLHIRDTDFANRLNVAYKHVSEWVGAASK